jgi:hypothetical protein
MNFVDGGFGIRSGYGSVVGHVRSSRQHGGGSGGSISGIVDFLLDRSELSDV